MTISKLTGTIGAIILSLNMIHLAQGAELGNRIKKGVKEKFKVREADFFEIQGINSSLKGENFNVDIVISGQTISIALQPKSVRSSKGYSLLIDSGKGILIPYGTEDVATFRGSVPGEDSIIIAGSIHSDGLRLDLLVGEQKYYVRAIQKRDASIGSEHYISYSADSVKGSSQNGLIDEVLIPEPDNSPAPPGTAQASSGGTGLYIAELATDSDYEFYQLHGSVEAVETEIHSVINAMNIQYERDVDISHTLTTLIVRTTPDDPYTTNHHGDLLEEFRTYWNANHTDVQRDIAQLFTGMDLQGFVIGVAYLGVICHSTYGYGLVQNNFSNELPCQTDLSAHEIGHMWDADHCENGSCQDPPFTMNPSLTCSNQFHSVQSIPEIIEFRDSRTCLEFVPDLPPPDPGDANGDGVVNVDDLSLIILHWEDTDFPQGDFNGDGVIDANDLSMVILYWGSEL